MLRIISELTIVLVLVDKCVFALAGTLAFDIITFICVLVGVTTVKNPLYVAVPLPV
jgi:hypothetical protein